jgi:hypothetical protein
MRVRSEYYREKAKRCRVLAKRTIDAEIAETLRGAATDYDQLAMNAEKRP